MSNFNTFFSESKRKENVFWRVYPSQFHDALVFPTSTVFFSGICYCLSAKLILEGTDGYARSGGYANNGGIGGSGGYGGYGGMDCIENFRISICPLS